jgi:hypothetical protein
MVKKEVSCQLHASKNNYSSSVYFVNCSHFVCSNSHFKVKNGLITERRDVRQGQGTSLRGA